MRIWTGIADAQIAVNTTPVGMFPNTGVSPVSLARFPELPGRTGRGL